MNAQELTTDRYADWSLARYGFRSGHLEAVAQTHEAHTGPWAVFAYGPNRL